MRDKMASEAQKPAAKMEYFYWSVASWLPLVSSPAKVMVTTSYDTWPQGTKKLNNLVIITVEYNKFAQASISFDKR